MENNKGLFQKLSEKTHSIVEAFHEIVQKGVTVNEIAEMVKSHDHTKKTTKTMLGLTFEFYTLRLSDLSFYLEMKKDIIDKIVSLKVYTENDVVLNYRSYDDGISLEDKVKAKHLPELVKNAQR